MLLHCRFLFLWVGLHNHFRGILMWCEWGAGGEIWSNFNYYLKKIQFVFSKVVIGRKRKVQLFGTSLKNQLEETGEEIPEIVESCAKYIAKYGKIVENKIWCRILQVFNTVLGVSKAFCETKKKISWAVIFQYSDTKQFRLKFFLSCL